MGCAFSPQNLLRTRGGRAGLFRKPLQTQTKCQRVAPEKLPLKPAGSFPIFPISEQLHQDRRRVADVARIFKTAVSVEARSLSGAGLKTRIFDFHRRSA
jgi:hypothetical protein